MFSIILYDSFTHGLPFHYILFSLAGALAGKIYHITNNVHFNKEEEIIELETGISAIIVTIITLFLRFFAGKWALTTLHVVWYSDALYLFFIGIYIEKIVVMKKQIDELVYDYIIKLRNE
jgi:uncharacterized membrane protein